MPKAITRHDEAKLYDLRHFDLPKLHHIYKSKRPYLDDYETDAEFKKINPCKPFYDEFVLPNEYVALRDQHYNERDVEKQKQAVPVGLEEAEQLLEKALRTVDQFLSEEDGNVFHAVSALGLLTGRRQVEIAHLGTFRTIEGREYQSLFEGLAKNHNSAFGIKTEIVIPLLIPCVKVQEAMEKIRPVLIDRTMGHITGQIQKSNVAVFGKKFTHTQKRNLYQELCYHKRDENKFMGGMGSKFVFASSALGHDVEMNTTSRYMITTVEK